MKKKKWFNRYIFFSITLVFVICCLMATGSWAAKKVKFYSANVKDYIRLLNENGSRESSSIGKTLGLTRDEGFLLLRKRTDFNGVTHYRYQQTYKGIPLWGTHTIVSRDHRDRAVRLNGAVVLDIGSDIKDISPISSLDPRDALTRMKTLHMERDIGAAWFFKNEQYANYIFIDKNSKAHLCCVVSFFADTECGNPSRYIHFIDAKTGKVLQSFDMMKFAVGTGPGGNLKIGYYEYGIDYPGFGVTEAGGICTMITPDVTTIDYEHTRQPGPPYSYTCYRNTHEEINGGYCPLNDAQFFGQAVYDMYRNWYSVSPIPFSTTLGCHYGVDYEGVVYDGTAMAFGDGFTTYYPLVALDLIAHEFSHAFTDYNSDLIYSGQSGGINESFSDMSGEAAKYYVRGDNNFMFCWDIYKDPDGALRYLYDPPLDGHSIDHVGDYYPGIDPHYSSGVFNKAFYLIATSTGWTTRMAFDIFTKANMDYWTPSTNFQQGAEGALAASEDYGYPGNDVINAFLVVGINLGGSCPGTIVNPGFETGTTSGWTEAGNVSITTDSHSGSYAVSLNGVNSSVEQTITGLCGSTTYIVSCWGKAKDPAGVYLGVKDYGGALQTVQFTNSKSFVKQSITFTTGAANTSATVFFIKLDSRFTGIGDDFEIN
ncbi:M4 family metallopeptidase [Acidobacteriota bacterium]